MSYKKASYLALSLLVLLAMAYLWSATELRDPRSRGSIGPGYFPIILGVLLILLCVLSFVQTMRRDTDQTISIPNLDYVVVTIAATSMLMVLWSYLGIFYPLVFVFVAGLMILFQPSANLRRLVIILVTSLAVTLAVFFLFDQVMSVRF